MQEKPWAIQYKPMQIIYTDIYLEQVTCKLQPVSHEQVELVSTNRVKETRRIHSMQEACRDKERKGCKKVYTAISYPH